MCEPDYTVDNKEIMVKEGFTKIAPFAAYRDLLNIPAGTVSIEFGLRVSLALLSSLYTLDVLCLYRIK